MNNSKFGMVILSALLALAVQGYGQNVFQVTIKGTSLTTNDSGSIISKKLDNKALIADAVLATGATNSAGLTVVYVQGASADPAIPGDFIEVVNSASGTPVYTNLLFLYGSPFPPALTNGAQDQLVAGAQVVPLPLGGTGDALGGATINARATPKKTLIKGTFNYTALRSPGSTSNNIVKIYSGSFSVNKAFVPK